MLNPSLGAIMSSAAKQSRLDREKDEANQLSMMQAGFIPKEQPAQPEPTALQSMLSSVRDQFAYQPEYAPTDYVPGPGHASSMQESAQAHARDMQGRQIESDERLDKWTIADMKAITQQRELHNEWFNRRTAADIANIESRTGLNKAQTSGVIADTSGKRLDNSLKRMTQRLKIESITLGNEEIRGNLERERGLNPLRESLMKHQIEAAELNIFKNQNALVTATNGDQYFMAYDAKTGTITPRIFSKAGEDMPEQMRMLSLGIQIASTLDEEPRKAMMATLLTQYRLMSLDNDMAGGVPEGGNILDPPEIEAPEDDAATKRENENFDSAYDEAIELTPEEETKRTLRENKPKGVTRKDWDWYVRHYDPEGGKVPRERGSVKKKGDPDYWSEVEKDATMTKKKQERYDSLHRLYKDEVARILGAG